VSGMHKRFIDITGNSAQENEYLIGRSFLHTRRGIRYVAIGFAWIGDLDMWGVMHHAANPEKDGDTVFVRSVANFKGKHLDGVPRFSEALKEVSY